jgi:muramoyltetrapeptide carboxypeptidase
MQETVDRQTALYPPALRRGDTIGLVAPAGAWPEEEFVRGVRIIGEHGFKVKIAPELAARQNYLAGSDRHRTDLLHAMWRDPEVKAVVAVRGGYGSLRILPAIDYRLIAECPKILVGFSDITALHSAIGRETGLVTFHGPMVTTLGKIDSDSLSAFFATLTRGACDPIGNRSLEILRGGKASGRLAGGNLTTAVHLVATPYEVSWRDRIVFLEDIGEAPYRIDRLLTHLHLAGRFAGIRGLILGSFTNCGDQELIWARAMEILADENFPIWADFPIGHGARNRIVPLNAEASMDSAAGQLTFTGPCCRVA